MASTKGALYLIPAPLIPGALQTLPPQVIAVIHNTHHYIVENARTARRLIAATKPPYTIDTLHITELNKHGDDDPAQLLAPLREGSPVGVLSDAGSPAIADPGSTLVRYAHRQGIRVVPLAGPSSITLALIASGLNGQQFCFHGYLSRKAGELNSDMRRLEKQALRDGATQLFIETPYRNRQVLGAALQILSPDTMFCIACDLTGDGEWIATKSIAQWRAAQIPDLHKRLAVFLIGV